MLIAAGLLGTAATQPSETHNLYQVGKWKVYQVWFQPELGVRPPTPQQKGYWKWVYREQRHGLESAMDFYRLVTHYDDQSARNIAVSDLMSAYIQTCGEHPGVLAIIGSWRAAIGERRWARWEERLEWRTEKACKGPEEAPLLGD